MESSDRPDTPRPPKSKSAPPKPRSSVATAGAERTDSPQQARQNETTSCLLPAHHPAQDGHEQEQSPPTQTNEQAPPNGLGDDNEDDEDSDAYSDSDLTLAAASIFSELTEQPGPSVPFPGYPQNHPVIPPVLFHLWNTTGKYGLWWRVIPPLQQYRTYPTSSPWQDPFPHTIPLDTPDDQIPLSPARIKEVIERQLADNRAQIAHSNGRALNSHPLPGNGMVSASDPPPLPPRPDPPLRTSERDMRIADLQGDLDFFRRARRDGTVEKGTCILAMTGIKIEIKKLDGAPNPNPRARPPPPPSLPPNWPLPPTPPSPQRGRAASVSPSIPRSSPMNPMNSPEVPWQNQTIDQRTKQIAKWSKLIADFKVKARAADLVNKGKGKAKALMRKILTGNTATASASERPVLRIRSDNPMAKTLDGGHEDRSGDASLGDRPENPMGRILEGEGDGRSDDDVSGKGKGKAKDGTDWVFMRDEYISPSRPVPRVRPHVPRQRQPETGRDVPSDGNLSDEEPENPGDNIVEAENNVGHPASGDFRQQERQKSTLTQVYRRARDRLLGRPRSGSWDSDQTVVQGEILRTAASRQRNDSSGSIQTVVRVGTSDQENVNEEASSIEHREHMDPSFEDEGLS